MTNNTNNDTPSKDSKYIQQHLASERTFLAWIRTAIAIIGVGFLVTNLHYTMKSSLSTLGDLLANVIGLASVVVGIITIIVAMIAYMKKIDTINNQSFRTPKFSVIMLGLFVIMIALFFGSYFLIL